MKTTIFFYSCHNKHVIDCLDCGVEITIWNPDVFEKRKAQKIAVLWMRQNDRKHKAYLNVNDSV